ncbi:MAG: hypothetical protein ACI9U0_001270 [Flavobacteriales bacterium]|jgi:hypothetical protein|tara:strand:+ start:3596 stop:4261 length:666 start_codon:yes stop_codon:yes gene_type:complete
MLESGVAECDSLDGISDEHLAALNEKCFVIVDAFPVLRTDGYIEMGFLPFDVSEETKEAIEVFQSVSEEKEITTLDSKDKLGKFILDGKGGSGTVNLLSNLSVYGFGVYNYDGVGIIKSRVERKTHFLGITKKEIQTLSLIDLNLNASFSFYKNYITYSKKAKNILLVFTHDGRLLIIEPKYLAQLVKDTEFQYSTKDISNEIQNSEDLLALIKSYSVTSK